MIMTKRNTVELPEDLVVEILSRVPAASLVRLRSSSKRWNVLIKDGRLAKKHYANAPRLSLIIMLINSRVYLVSVDLDGNHNIKVMIKSQISLQDRLSDSLEEVDIYNIFHCDGLLLCTTMDYRLVVWNPCLRETKWIQPRNAYKKIVDIYALGKSSCNKYKILRIDQFGYTSPILLHYEIYDFTSNSWRVVGKTSDWFIPRWADRGISVNGNTYWLASTQDLKNGIFLLGFDFSTETFAKVSLPGDDHLSYQVVSLSVTREDPKLCVLLATQRVTDVWIATTIESTGVASWCKFLSVNLANIYKPFRFGRGMNFLVDLENKVLVCRGEHWISNGFINVVGEDICIQVHHDDESRCSLVVNYVPTLVQIQQGL